MAGGHLTRHAPAASTHPPFYRSDTMTWTKPEFEVVEVTMEITAYVARR